MYGSQCNSLQQVQGDFGYAPRHRNSLMNDTRRRRGRISQYSKASKLSNCAVVTTFTELFIVLSDDVHCGHEVGSLYEDPSTNDVLGTGK